MISSLSDLVTPLAVKLVPCLLALDQKLVWTERRNDHKRTDQRSNPQVLVPFLSLAPLLHIHQPLAVNVMIQVAVAALARVVLLMVVKLK